MENFNFTKNDLISVAKYAAKAALLAQQMLNDKQRKQTEDGRLHNTRLFFDFVNEQYSLCLLTRIEYRANKSKRNVYE